MASGLDGVVVREVGRLLGGGSVVALGEGQLLERFVADRDEAAFEALVGRHGPMVLGTCRRMLLDPRDVEDAFQATFLVLARRAGSIRDGDRLGPWLHGVARRVAARARALAARRRAVEGPGGEDRAVTPPDPPEGAELREVLDEELARLPEKYRAPLVLCYLEGLTHDEAARQLRWPIGTVRSRLAGGRDRLRSRLARRGLAPSAALPGLVPIPALPEALLSTTARLATASGPASAHVASLAKGALVTMIWNKFKAVAVVGLVAGLTAGGVAAVGPQQPGNNKAEAPAVAEPKPQDPIDNIKVARIALKAELDTIHRRIEEIRYERAMELPKLEAKVRELNARGEALDQRWKELVSQGPPTASATAPEDPAERIKKLEGELRAERQANLELRKQLDELRAASQSPPAARKSTDARASGMMSSGMMMPGDTGRGAPGAAAGMPGMMGSGMGMGASMGGAARKLPMRIDFPDNVHILVVPAEHDRATVINTETNARETYRPPQGVTEIVPVVGLGASAIQIKGSEITQVAAYDTKSAKWYPQDLREPAKDGAAPVVGNSTVRYQVGRFLYLFSTHTKKWAVLELKRDPGRNGLSVLIGDQNGKMTIPEGNILHIYNAKTGEWTHIDTNDDK